MSICMHLRLTYDCEWLWPSGWPAVMHDGRVQLDAALGPYQIPAAVKVYYIMEACWYSSGFCLLLLCVCVRGGAASAPRASPRPHRSRSPPPRPSPRPPHRYKKKKDFAEMCAHHIITFSMLFLSYSTGYIRIGLVVIILHNAFDPFLHLAKCTHYIDLPVVPDVSFACCALSFSITRLYFYPQAIWYAWAGVCADTATCPGGLMDKTPVEFTLIGLLWALVPIHVMWFFMIIKVLKKALTNGKAQGDVRSDSEDDEDEPKKPKGKKVD